MRTPLRFLALAVLAVGPLMIVPACSKDDGSSNRSTTPGPAEKAGAKVDEAGREVKEGVKEGAEKTKDAAKGAASAVGSAVERTGEKIQGK